MGKNCDNYPFDHFAGFVFSSYGVKECEEDHVQVLSKGGQNI